MNDLKVKNVSRILFRALRKHFLASRDILLEANGEVSVLISLLDSRGFVRRICRLKIDCQIWTTQSMICSLKIV